MHELRIIFIRRPKPRGGFMYSFFTMLLLYTTATAQDFNLDDTGVEEEAPTIEHTDLWPAKIVLDTTKKTFKLVWFETEPPRHTDIEFALISSLQLVPQYEGRAAELQILLTDERKFLLDVGPHIRKTAQTFSVLAKTPMVNASTKSERIIPKPAPKRNAPVLVIGSLEGPDVLLPPSESTMEDGPHLQTPVGNLTVNTESVDYIIKQNMGKFRPCYAKQRESNDALSGRVDVEFTLNTKGEVSSAEIKSTTLNNSLVETCVLHQLRGLAFHPPSKEKTITYPFMFQ